MKRTSNGGHEEVTLLEYLPKSFRVKRYIPATKDYQIVDTIFTENDIVQINPYDIRTGLHLKPVIGRITDKTDETRISLDISTPFNTQFFNIEFDIVIFSIKKLKRNPSIDGVYEIDE